MTDHPTLRRCAAPLILVALVALPGVGAAGPHRAPPSPFTSADPQARESSDTLRTPADPQAHESNDALRIPADRQAHASHDALRHLRRTGATIEYAERVPGRPQGQQPTPEHMREMMERHRAAAQPGPEHQRLARMQGTWDVELEMWPQPGADRMIMAGTMEAEMILGNRFLVQTIDLADTDPAGEQMSIIGFDRRSNEYTVMGMDTSGTYWVTARGPADEGGNRAVLSGEDYDPIVDGTQLYDFVLSWPDDDTFVVEIVFKDDIHTRGGPPFKMVEVTSRRRQ